jgi:hypothetical protein
VNQIVVVIPVLDRPANAPRVIESLRRSGADARPVFLCSPDDRLELRACRRTKAEVIVVDWEPGPGDWARKINEGYRRSSEPYILLGADDLRFHPDWDRAALRRAREGIGVIGTNDLGNAIVMRGQHATHPIVTRAYADEHGTIDQPGLIVHEGYQHQWVDNELVQTAMSRLAWTFARDSHVEHLHPFWHKAEMDATYKKALSTSPQDRRLFLQRARLWAPGLRATRSSRTRLAGRA